MSQENVEIVRRLYRAWAAGDAAGLELVHPEAEWIPDSRTGEGPIRGRENALRWHGDRGEMFEAARQEVERLFDKGDKVLAFIRFTGRGRASGAPFDIRTAQLWTVRDGLVIRGQGYGNRDEALEAAGLSEQDPHADS